MRVCPKGAAAESVSAANDLLETDAAKAAQLAEANAPAGPSYETAWFILQLAQRDPAAADRVYAAYLSSSSAWIGAGFERVLWLAGYPFGYAEAFGGSLDPYAAYQALKEGVKVVNGARMQDVENFRVLRKVNLACQPGEESWYGNSDHAERFSLFDSFAALVGVDVEGGSVACARVGRPFDTHTLPYLHHTGRGAKDSRQRPRGHARRMSARR